MWDNFITLIGDPNTTIGFVYGFVMSYFYVELLKYTYNKSNKLWKKIGYVCLFIVTMILFAMFLIFTKYWFILDDMRWYKY